MQIGHSTARLNRRQKQRRLLIWAFIGWEGRILKLRSVRRLLDSYWFAHVGWDFGVDHRLTKHVVSLGLSLFRLGV